MQQPLRRKQLLTLPVLIALIILTACGGAAPTNRTVAPDAAAVDLSALPDLVDATTVNAIRERSEVFLLDVREQSEYDEGHIPGVTLIPSGSVASRLSEIPHDKTVIVSCRSGNRSSQVVAFLRQQGYTNIHDLQGGILAWQQAGLPVEQ
ncbi:MAG: rhodanese-like domain-containing protein [Caldilineaceae bacterium]